MTKDLKIGQAVEITGGTYGKRGMIGKITAIPSDIYTVEVEGQCYQKHAKNIAPVETTEDESK